MKQRGFTLIELLVVISIIALLSSVVLSSLSRARTRARDAQRLSQLRQINTALQAYYYDKGSYPPVSMPGGNFDWSVNSDGTTNSYNDMMAVLKAGGYMNGVPKDPAPSSVYFYDYKPWCGVPGAGNNTPYRITALAELPQPTIFSNGGSYDIGATNCQGAY